MKTIGFQVFELLIRLTCACTTNHILLLCGTQLCLGRSKTAEAIKSKARKLQRKSILTENIDTILGSIRDAIIVCRNLGIRYLWVDSLCIIQDDIEDVEAQISNMAQTYSKAYVTIVAAHGSDANAGLPGVQPSSRKVFQPTFTLGHDTFILAQHSRTVMLENSKWITRRWTYQEQALSTRLLVFTERQASFFCHKGYRAEDEHDGGDCIELQFPGDRMCGTAHYAGTNSVQNTITFSSILRQYLQRQLSHPEDIEAAFAGIASALEP